MYDRHRIRRWRIGREEDLASFTREDVLGYYRSRYVPERTIVGIVGDVDPEAALALARAAYGDWAPASGAVDPSPAEPERRDVRGTDSAWRCDSRASWRSAGRECPRWIATRCHSIWPPRCSAREEEAGCTRACGRPGLATSVWRAPLLSDRDRRFSAERGIRARAGWRRCSRRAAAAVMRLSSGRASRRIWSGPAPFSLPAGPAAWSPWWDGRPRSAGAEALEDTRVAGSGV